MEEKKKVRIGIGEFIVTLLIVLMSAAILVGILYIKARSDKQLGEKDDRINVLEKQVYAGEMSVKGLEAESKAAKDSAAARVSIDEAYKILKEKHEIVDKACEYRLFNTNDKEVTDYKAVIEKYFTSNGEKDLNSIMKVTEINGKYFWEPAASSYNFVPFTKEFVNVEITDDTISCIVDYIYRENPIVTKVDEEYYKKNGWFQFKEAKFTLKKVDNEWKIEHFEYPKAK